jgi:hypothetical protein
MRDPMFLKKLMVRLIQCLKNINTDVGDRDILSEFIAYFYFLYLFIF